METEAESARYQLLKFGAIRFIEPGSQSQQTGSQPTDEDAVASVSAESSIAMQ